MNKRFAIGLMFVLGMGCGDGDDNGNAPEQCRKVVDATCEKAASCRIDSGDTDDMQAAVDECLQALKDQDFDCADAVQPLSDVNQCLEDIDSAACSDLMVQDDGTLANIPITCGQ